MSWKGKHNRSNPVLRTDVARESDGGPGKIRPSVIIFDSLIFPKETGGDS